MGACEGPALVREDRAGRTAGGPVAWQHAAPGSRVRQGEPLTASKWETRLQMRPPADSTSGETPRRRRGREAAGGQRATAAAEPCSWSTAHTLLLPIADSPADRYGILSNASSRRDDFEGWVRPARGRGRRGPTRSHPEPDRETRQRRRVLWFQRHGRRGHRGRTSPPSPHWRLALLLCRGVEQRQLVGLITRRSAVRIRPPLPLKAPGR